MAKHQSKYAAKVAAGKMMYGFNPHHKFSLHPSHANKKLLKRAMS